jgi:tRNA G46 methylase TrmB
MVASRRSRPCRIWCRASHRRRSIRSRRGCACGIERLSAHQQKFVLVPTVLLMPEGVVDKLERGADVADVGCGAAQSTVAMAQAFPNSRFIG